VNTSGSIFRQTGALSRQEAAGQGLAVALSARGCEEAASRNAAKAAGRRADGDGSARETIEFSFIRSGSRRRVRGAGADLPFRAEHWYPGRIRLGLFGSESAGQLLGVPYVKDASVCAGACAWVACQRRHCRSRLDSIRSEFLRDAQVGDSIPGAPEKDRRTVMRPRMLVARNILSIGAEPRLFDLPICRSRIGNIQTSS